MCGASNQEVIYFAAITQGLAARKPEYHLKLEKITVLVNLNNKI